MSWNVDASAEADSYVGYLDTFSGIPGADMARRTLLASLGPQPGESWFDVGCGIGDDAILLATMVSPGGRVVAVDASVRMIDECRKRLPPGAPMATQVADVRALPFSAGTFDGVFANRLLQHLPSPPAAVREMVRVTRPGGTIAIAEPDWDTFAVEPPAGRSGSVMSSFRSAGVASPRVGSELGSLLIAHGAGDVSVVSLDWSVREYAVANVVFRLEETAERATRGGAILPDAAAGWVADLRSAANDGRFAARVTLFFARGVKS